MSTYLTEASDTLEYQSYDYSNKTIDLLGEEFIKKEEAANAVVSSTNSTMSTASLPSLTYTTTTIPTISSGEEAGGVLYYNLDELSRYMPPENFSFDMSGENIPESSLGLEEINNKMMISIPGDRGTQSFSIQLKSTSSAPPTSSSQLVTFPTVDTTKLAGQLSVVQELPEVSRLVFQEVKHESDNIVNILETMKEEDPLDYTVSSADSPLNLVNSSKGLKRVMSHSSGLVDSKRLKNVLVLQGENGQQILHQLPTSNIEGFSHLNSIRSVNSDLDLNTSLSYLDPPSPKSENKARNANLKLSYPTKTVAGTVIPSSKTCNWVFENGQVCGKTFSKSYNLVVHMRMHEDIRPFACTLCDQTFRQKAHLQRHETTHGIQSKNFYRNPPGSRRRKRGSPKITKGLQDRISNAQVYRKKLGADSEGEEMLEDEEDDVYIPNGVSSSRISGGRKYSNPECEGEDREMDSDTAGAEGGKVFEPMHAGSPHSNQQRQSRIYNSKDNLQVSGGDDSEMMSALNLAQQRQDDDDTSTVQDILHTVNSVPTLEQKLESYSLQESLKGRNHRLVDTSSISSLTLSNNNLPAGIYTTLSQHLPGATTTAQTNILYTTLAGSTSNSKLLSLMENNQNKNAFVIENLDEHSPEIQAELLNALLADESYQGEEEEELCQEEVYRLNTLPAAWWVLRRRKNEFIFDITYYSPQGLAFKTKADIQNFLTHNLIPRETKQAGLRQPPIPIDEIPVIDDDMAVSYPPVTSAPPSIDANSIAQALIANLKPEPMESLQESLAERRSMQEAAAHTLTAS